MTTDAEKLVRIAALCQPQARDSHHLLKFMAEVRAILAEPVPRTPAVGSIDRAALLREIDHAWSHAQRNDVLADRILALLCPVEGVISTTTEGTLP